MVSRKYCASPCSPVKAERLGGMAGGTFSQTKGDLPMLTILACKSAIKQARQQNKRIKLFDGNGLFLDCRPNGSGHWRYKYRVKGREKLISFGAFPLISLEEARQKHNEARKVVANNDDPSAARQRAKREINPTFEQVGKDWFLHNRQKWCDDHANEVMRRLVKDLFSLIGKLPVKDISRLVLLQALQKMEARKSHDIAKRSLQYATNILRFAAVREYVPYNVALDLKGALKPYKPGHLPSMDIDQLPAFLSKLDDKDINLLQDEKDILMLLMLTLVRSSELMKAKWSEFDFDKAIWTIPAARMKMKREHLVPLSRQVMAILLRRKTSNSLLNPSWQSDYVFPSITNPHKPINKVTGRQALYAMGYRNIHTPHGFRALGMGIAKERLKYRHEVPDRQLAHVPASGVDRAYDRALFIEERTEMMQRLADYVDR